MKSLQDLINEKTVKAQQWVKNNLQLSPAAIVRYSHYAGFPGVFVEISTDGIQYVNIKYIE